MKKWLITILFFVLGAAFSGCQMVDTVHQFPEPGKEVDPTLVESTIIVKMKVNLDIAHVIEPGSKAALPIDITQESADKYDRRFKVEIYNNEDFDKSLHSTYLFTRTAEETGPLAFNVELKTRHYKLAIWMDFVKKGTSDDLYYSTTPSLASVHVPSRDKYSAGSDFKEAQTFLSELDLTPYVNQWFAELVIEAPFERPVAKIRFLANDFEKFAETIGSTKPLEELAKDYVFEFSYNGYFPTGFNVTTGRLNDSEVGFGFNHYSYYPSVFKEKKYTLVGSDYVFVNGASSTVTVSAVIKDKAGNIVNEVSSIVVPIARGGETVVIYKFFTKEYVPGIGIDPEFDGEFNVYV